MDSHVSKPLKNPYTDMTETNCIYELQNGIKNIEIPVMKT